MYRYSVGLLTVLLLITASSCTKTRFHPTDPSASYNPTDQVRVLRNFPDIKYYEIGTVRAVGPNKDKLLNSIREKARKVGAHAIVVKPAAVRNNDYTSRHGGTEFSKVEYIMEAVALRFN